ncbi:MAG: Cna B-type domain-containing protein [Ruminococcus sp.]|nr:Cna B-type domain-containing protein [Ruminococcus sp.]
MTFVVPYAEFIPAEAIKISTPIESVTMTTGDNATAWFEDVQGSPLGDNLSGKIKTIKIGNTELTGSDTTEIIAGNADPLHFKMSLSYGYDGGQFAESGILDSHCVYYQSPPNTVEINQDYFGKGSFVRDDDWSVEVPSGYYSISQTGLIVIRFTDDYINYLSKSSNGFSGTIAFDAKIAREDSADGDREFTLEGREVEVKFDDEELSMSKDGRSAKDNDGQYVQWNITINNPNGHIDLSEYTINDLITDTDTSNNSSSDVDWSGIYDVVVNPDGAASKNDTGFSLTGNAPQVTISYKQRAQSGHSYKNNATLKKGDEDKGSQEKTVTIENALEAFKTGTPDYSYYANKKEGKKVVWTIDVRNKSGDSLDKTKITDAQFPNMVSDSLKVYVFDSNNQKTEITSGFTLNGNELSFENSTDLTLPSHLEVVYETALGDFTDADNNKKVITANNSAKVESTKSDNPPKSDEDNKAEVTYEHQYSMTKGCSIFDTETDMLQWKIKVYAGNATLDGYKITDDAITNLIYDNNQRNGQYISFNAYTNGESVNITENVELVKAEGSEELTVKLKDGVENIPISVIEIFYMQDIANNLTTENLQKYQQGEGVTVSNTATGQMPNTGVVEEGTGQREGHKRVESSKIYQSTANEKAIGNADKKDRILDWKINLINDSGFKTGDKSVTDILQGTGGGQHYITPAQAANIKLMGKTSETATETEITSGYTIVYYDAAGNEIADFANGTVNAVRFEVRFTDDTTLANTHYISITYKTTADVSGVENGSTAQFNNELYYESDTPKTVNGLTFEREDPTVMKYVSLYVEKTWDDRNNKFNTRPDNYTIQVWQAEADENGQCPPVDDTSAWTKIGEDHVIQSSTTGSQLLGNEFPQWAVKEDENGVQSVSRYYYKIVEVVPENYTISHISAPVMANQDSSTLRITNKADLDVMKNAVDKNGNEITDIDLSKVPKKKVKIGGTDVDCYIFGWLIYFKDGETHYTDTLPTGAIYLNGSEEGLSEYAPKIDNGGWETTLQDYWITVTPSGNTLAINLKNSDFKTFKYYTAIPANQIDAALQGGLLINSVKIDGSDKNVNATLSVNKDSTDDTQHLDKGTIPTISGGIAKYYMDVNPTGKKLSNDGYINITDELGIDADSNNKNIKIVLDDIKVYPYENGAVDKFNPIQDFSYTVDYDYAESTNLTFSEAQNGNLWSNQSKYWIVDGWEVGKNVTITVPKNPDFQSNEKKLYLFVYKDGNINPLDLGSGYNEITTFSAPDSNGNVTAQFTVPDDYTNDSKIVIVSQSESYQSSDKINDYNVAENGVSVSVDGNPLTISSPNSTIYNNVTYRYWEITGWQEGQNLTITMNENPEILSKTSDNMGDVVLLAYSTDDYNLSNLYWPNGIVEWAGNFNKQKVWNYQVPNGLKHIFVLSQYVSDKSYNALRYSTNGGFTGVSSSDSIPVVLNVSVPDQQHVRVEYSYRVTGYTPKKDNQEGDKIYFSNKASFETDNGSGWDEEKHNQLNVQESNATSEATKYPKIYKVDVNDYSMNMLNTSFKVAKWDTEHHQWVYASAISDNQIEGSTKTVRKFTFPETTNGYLETVRGDKHYAPDNAAELKLSDTDDNNTPSTDTIHEFLLTDKTLYKFVEVQAPDGYKQPDANGSLEDNSEFVYYYAYNGYDGNIPADAKYENGRSKVQNIVVNGTLNIPNSKEISIKAQKIFTGANIPESAEVTFELYYSTDRGGKNQKLVTSDMLINSTASFKNQKALTFSSSSPEQTVEWESLPSGINGAAIYYFVRETSVKYTVNNVEKTYTLDESDGKLKSGSEECPFQPVYTRNGTNKDGTVVQVNNSEGILVRKKWLNADGRAVNPPKDSATNNPMSIKFEVYGIKGSYRVKLNLTEEQSTLNSTNNYQILLPDKVKLTGVTSQSVITALEYTENKEYDLSYFDNFEIVEVLTPEQVQEMYGKFGNPQTTRMISNGTGILEMINTDLRSDTVDVRAEKKWDDNNKSHTGDSVTFELVQSTNSNLTSDDLNKIAKNETITKNYAVRNDISSSNSVVLALKNTSITVDFTTDVKEIKFEDNGWTGTISLDKKQVTISAHDTGKTVMTAVFDDDTEQQKIISVIDSYEATLSSANDWKAEWNDLPAVDDEGGTYYYYVIERNVPENYEAVYSKTSTSDEQSVIVTNVLPIELKVIKKWYDSSGNEISNIDNNPAIPDKIKVEVYQKLLKEEEVVGEDVPKPSNFKVIALGDSITLGSFNNIEQQYRYPNRLQEKLINGGFNSANVQNHGVNSEEIENMRARVAGIDFTDVNALTLLAGTNDVMHGKSEGAVERYKQLVEDIFAKAQAAGIKNFKIYAATIPYITRLDWFPLGTTQQQANTLVENFNDGITSLINGDTINKSDADYEIVLVDVNSAVDVIDANGNELGAGEIMLIDQCHPNIRGYEEIAKAFYNAIRSKYTTSEIHTKTNPTDVDLPSESYDINSLATGTLYGTYDVEKSKGYELILKNLPKTNALGEEYVYYIRETGTHTANGDSYRLTENSYRYISGVQYVNNGMTASEEDSMTIKNKVKTTQLNISKEWSDGNENHTNDTITVRIHRDTVADSANARKNPLTLTLNKEEVTLYKGSTVSAIITSTVPVKPVTNDKIDITLDASQQKITLTPKEGADTGDVTVTFESEDGQTTQLTVHIIEKPELNLILDKYELKGGDAAPVVQHVYTITDYDVKEDATYSSTNENVISIDYSGVMTVNGIGTATITATYISDGKELTATKDITVSYSDDFDVTGSIDMKTGETKPLGINPYFGEFEYTVTKDGVSSDGLTVAGNEVTASKTGTYTITVTRSDGKTHNVAVNVVQNSTFSISNDTEYFEVDSTKKIEKVVVKLDSSNLTTYHQLIIEPLNANKGWADVNYGYYQANGFSEISYDIGKSGISFIGFARGQGDCPINITDVNIVYETPKSVDSTPQSFKTLTRFNASGLRLGAAKLLAAKLGTPENSTQSAITPQEEQSFAEHGYIEKTISNSDNWQIAVSELPQYYIKSDGTVANYYYWAEEISGADGYKASYSFKDNDDETDYSINASQSGDALIKIKNTLNQTPESVELPESGGSGTTLYYTISGILLMLSAVGYVTIKRRRWSDE